MDLGFEKKKKNLEKVNEDMRKKKREDDEK